MKLSGMKSELDEVHWHDNIPRITSYGEKWRIVIWAKAQPMFKGASRFSRSITLDHYLEGKIVLMIQPTFF